MPTDNLLAGDNATFEAGIGTWTKVVNPGSFTLAHSTADGGVGRIVMTAGSSFVVAHAAADGSTRVPVDPAEGVLDANFRLRKLTGASSSVRTQIQFYRADGTSIQVRESGTVTVAPGTVYASSFISNIVPPADAVFCRLRTSVFGGMATGDEFYLDDAHTGQVGVSATQPPTVSAGPDVAVVEGARFDLAGSGAASTPGNTLTYAWSEPSPLDDATVAAAWGTAPAGPTTLTYTLTVTEVETGLTATDTVAVVVDDAPPTASAGPDVAFPVGSAWSITGVGTDPADPVAYAWGVAGDPDGTGITTATLTGTDTATVSGPPSGTPGVVTLSFAVTAGGVTTTDFVAVTFVPVDQPVGAWTEVTITSDGPAGVARYIDDLEIIDSATGEAHYQDRVVTMIGEAGVRVPPPPAPVFAPTLLWSPDLLEGADEFLAEVETNAAGASFPSPAHARDLVTYRVDGPGGHRFRTRVGSAAGNPTGRFIPRTPRTEAVLQYSVWFPANSPLFAADGADLWLPGLGGLPAGEAGAYTSSEGVFTGDSWSAVLRARHTRPDWYGGAPPAGAAWLEAEYYAHELYGVAFDSTLRTQPGEGIRQPVRQDGANSGGLLPILPGTWYDISLRVAVNNPGASDGFVEVYVDGVLRMRTLNVRWTSTNTAPPVNQVIAETYYATATTVAHGVDYERIELRSA